MSGVVDDSNRVFDVSEHTTTMEVSVFSHSDIAMDKISLLHIE